MTATHPDGYTVGVPALTIIYDMPWSGSIADLRAGVVVEIHHAEYDAVPTFDLNGESVHDGLIICDSTSSSCGGLTLKLVDDTLFLSDAANRAAGLIGVTAGYPVTWPSKALIDVVCTINGVVLVAVAGDRCDAMSELGDERVGPLGVWIQHHDPRTEAGEVAHGRAAQSAGAAGDDSGTTLDVHQAAAASRLRVRAPTTDTATDRYAGTRVHRVENPRLLPGRGTFVDVIIVRRRSRDKVQRPF